MEAPTTQKKSNEKPVENSNLCDLPEELLGLIIDHLNLVDRFHLALVCTRFLTIVRTAPRQSGLLLGSPCLLTIANDSRTCSLINPLHTEKYRLNTISLPSKVEIKFSKDGWLLMLSQLDIKSIFFFNPLTKVTISLPDIDFPPICAFSFTSPPTSPDCLVVAVNAIGYGANIYTCRRGDDKWSKTEHDYEGDSPFYMRYNTPVFLKGIFYCLGNSGMLSIFDPVDETWVVKEKPGLDKRISHRNYLVESEGELFRVWASKNGDSVHVHKLNPLTNQWEVIDTIGDKQAYVGSAASICSNVGSSKGGRIYFQILRDEDVIFYSCETREINRGKNFFCAQDYSLACWIEPKWIKPSPDELQWSKL